MPAKAEGTWRGQLTGGVKPLSFDLQIEQKFQKITGNATFDKLNTTLRDAHLQGNAIRFSFTDADGRVREFTGRINGNRMAGESKGLVPGRRLRWQATKN